MLTRRKRKIVSVIENRGVHSPCPSSTDSKQQYNIIDILRTEPSELTFNQRVKKIGLSPKLIAKIHEADRLNCERSLNSRQHLSEDDEKELATEVLLARHKFTRLVFEHRDFRQAALTIIQNIYLFKQRKIFFGTSGITAEQERQEALLLFSQSPATGSIPLAKSFQHLIVARVWHRINDNAQTSPRQNDHYRKLHDIVEQLNTLRNIYMLLSLGLAHKLTRNVNSIYQQSITNEDAHQIGNFGIARAAYRYHPSIGLRFSTYASHWINKELQRQALAGRLIRISANLVDQISQEAKNRTLPRTGKAYARLCGATAQLAPGNDFLVQNLQKISSINPSELMEKRELQTLLLEAINRVLPTKSGDVIMRRYGLGPYYGKEQSVIDIAQEYEVTRGSIYQLEQTALNKLKEYIKHAIPA